MFAFNWLNGGVKFVLVFGVLTELRKHFSDVVNKQLREFFVGLEHKAEKLAMVIVNYV